MDNIWQAMCCTASMLMLNKHHMDMHRWMEHTPLLKNNSLNVPNIFWRTVLSSEAIQMEVIYKYIS